MQPLRIINRDFQLLGEITKYTSLIIERKFFGIGVCEFRVNRYTRYVDKLEKDNIVFLSNQTHKAFIIKHKEIEIDEHGKATENWIIRGYQLKVIAMQRLILPPPGQSHNVVTANTETAMHHFLTTELISPTDSDRTYPNLILGTNNNYGTSKRYQARFDALAEKLGEMGVVDGLGWDIVLDLENKCFKFIVIQGINRSADQSIVTPIIFSTEYKTLKSMSYVQSAMDYRNVAFVAGQGEGVNRRVVKVGHAVGSDLFEMFVDARDVSETDDNNNPRPESAIINDLAIRANSKLIESAQTVYCEGQILQKDTMKYEQHYHLGDIVTLQNKEWGITMNTRITAVREIHENGMFEIEPTFDNDRPTLISKIKNELNAIRNELKR